MGQELSDNEKQRLLATLHLHRLFAPGLDRLALRIAESISDEKGRNSEFLALPGYLAASGNLELADEVARYRIKGYARASALAGIAAELVNSHPPRAVAYLQESESLVQELDDADDRAAVLQQISRVYSQLRDWSKARDLAERIPIPSDRTWTLCEIAEDLWRAGEAETANELLADARASVPETSLNDRAGALDDVAKVLAKMGRASEALEVWEQAIHFANQSPEPSKFLFSICKKLISVGQINRAREVAHLISNEARRSKALSLTSGAPPVEP